MFNRSFNLTSYVNELRSLALKRAAFTSLASTLSWRICVAADNMVAALIKREYTFDELKELNARDFKALLSGPETGPGKNEMAELRKLWLLRAEYAAYIEAFTIDDKPKDGEKPAFGSIKATLDTMSGPQRERKIDPRKIKEAESIGFTYTPEEIKNAVAEKLRDDNHWAGIRAKRLGFTEWIIDQMFAQVTDDGDDENYSQLSEQSKEWLCEKMQAFCGAELSNIKQDQLFNRKSKKGLGLGDAILLQRCVAELPDMIYVTAASKAIAKAKAPVDKAITVKAKRVRKAKVATVTRAPAPTQATTVTTVNDNGFKVTRAVA